MFVACSAVSPYLSKLVRTVEKVDRRGIVLVTPAGDANKIDTEDVNMPFVIVGDKTKSPSISKVKLHQRSIKLTRFLT